MGSIGRSVALLVAIAALTATSSAVAAGSKTSVGRLQLCAYVSANSNNTTPTENVKIQATGGKGHIGTVTIEGAGLNHTSHFTLSKLGSAITPFEVTSAGVATVTVKLARLPAKTRVLHLTLNPSSTLTQAGCTLH